MKKTAWIISLCLMATHLMAHPVGDSIAQQVADHFWQTALGGRGTMQQQVWPYSHVYLFTSEQGGYVIVSADDCVRPVLAYSASSNVDPDDLPVQMAERVALLDSMVSYAVWHNAQATAVDADRWQRLLSGAPVKSGETVGPLLTTQWHQDRYYSMYCPTGTVTGCAATAQAQFMRYWNWPPIGRGNEAYSLQSYGQQSADFAHTLYDWDNMPARVENENTTAEKVAVATLMYHVGVSLHMQYNTPSGGGSAAAGIAGEPGYPSIDNSLKDYFYYSPNMRGIFKNQGFTDQRWADSLKAELDLLHPMVYCGVATQGGHGFVCDGYQWQDDQIYFHFNFGWAGRGDGYYTVDNICPPVSPTGVEDGVYVFNLSNQALLGAVPDYRLIVSDSILHFGREGETQPLLFSSLPFSDNPWNISCSEPWVSVDRGDVDKVGQLTVQVQPNNSGSERSAQITFSQDGQTVSMQVVQTYYSPDEYCPLTVVMQNTERQGWEGGAYLSFESLSGFVYATATLGPKALDTVSVQVAPHDVVVLFHHGGGTDRYINYYVLNQYGEHLVDVEYAFRDDDPHFIEWPCVHVGLEDVEREACRVWPNPIADRLHVDASGLRNVEVLDMTGRIVTASTAADLPVGELPAGLYMLRITTDSGIHHTKIVKQ